MFERSTIIGVLFLAALAYEDASAQGFVLQQKDGVVADDHLGRSLASVGDVNGDGRTDYIVGAYNAGPRDINGAGAGAAFVYSGATGAVLYEKHGAAAGDQFGFSVAGAGDVDGDGRPDFVIGAHAAGFGAGAAFVYSGATGALLYQKSGGAPGDLLGYSVGSAGDVNGDGRADFIVGANAADPGGRSAAGSAYVYSGATGGLLLRRDGAAAGDQLGISVAPAGDANGDGKFDVIVGAGGASPGGNLGAGSAYVLSLTAPGVSVPTLPHTPSLVLMPPAPNPTRGLVMVSYALPQAAAVRVSLFDLQGREVSLVDEGERAAGLHEVPLDASRFRPGLYFMKLASTGGILQQHVVIAR